MRLIFAFACAMTALTCSAQECENVIALSKTVSTTVSDKESLESHAANFCSEYKNSRSSSSGTSFGASYKFLAASYGTSNANADEVASKYCSASSDYSARKDAYKQYVENIAPSAYAAYESCISMSREVRFELNVPTLLPTEFSILTSFRSAIEGRKEARLAYTASQGISCFWRGGGKSDSVNLATGATTELKCSRQSAQSKGHVTIFRGDTSERGNSMSIPWVSYTSQGVPSATIEQLQSSLRQAEQRIQQISSEIAAERKDRQTLLAGANQYVERIPNSALSNYGVLCTAQATLCHRTVHNYCKQAGYLGGVPQEWNDQNHEILCIGKR